MVVRRSRVCLSLGTPCLCRLAGLGERFSVGPAAETSEQVDASVPSGSVGLCGGAGGTRASDKTPLLFFFSFLASFTISLHKVDNVTVTIKPKPGVFPRCQIRVKTTFRSELRIKPGENVTFAFTCSTPEKYFVMEIQKNIGKMRVIFPPVNPHTFFSCCCVKVSLNNGFPCNLG